MIVFVVESTEGKSAFFDLTNKNRKNFGSGVSVVFSHKYVGSGTARECALKVKQKIKKSKQK
jgi:hypothetical protein